MKYIKKFEKNPHLDLINDYKKYENKFFLLNKQDIMVMCKMLEVEKYWINWEEYDYDNFEKAYQVIRRCLHIRDFDKYLKIINTFDTFKEMKEEYNLLTTSNKYNL